MCDLCLAHFQNYLLESMANEKNGPAYVEQRRIYKQLGKIMLICPKGQKNKKKVKKKK